MRLTEGQLKQTIREERSENSSEDADDINDESTLSIGQKRHSLI